MKLFTFLCFLFVSVQPLFSQVVIEENPSYTSSAEKPVLDELLNIDVLDGSSIAQTIAPNSEKLCFDKVFKLTSRSLKGEISVCMFINTKIGLVAYLTPKKGNANRDCSINSAEPDFSLSVIGLKGNTFTYYNVKKQTGIEQWFTTGNSEAFRYAFTSSTQEQVLFKKDESREYLDGKVKAWAYAAPDRPEKWFLFGKNLPVKVVMQPLKYLGNFGVGFQYTEQGLFIIMQVESEIMNSSVKELKDTYLCFDPSPYKKIEDKILNEGLLSINKKRDRLRSRLPRVPSDGCGNLEIRNIQYEIIVLDEQEENLKRSTKGNIVENSATRQAMAQSMANYDNLIQQTIYETELDICKNEKLLQEAQNAQQTELFTNENYKRRKAEYIQCLKAKLLGEKETQQKIKRINNQFPNDLGRQMSEKAKVFLQGMRGCNS
jgi:hypothetical protein